MIGFGMPVQVRRCGTSVAVEQLVIGDLVYDPLSDNYIELVDILSRGTAALGNRLVRLRADVLRPGCPSRDVLVSRQQCIGVATRTSAPDPMRLEFRPAHRLGEEVGVPTRLFALFPERSGCISVAGMLLQVQDMAALLAGAPAAMAARQPGADLSPRLRGGRE